jgi:iron complex outermembrane recepter protein
MRKTNIGKGASWLAMALVGLGGSVAATDAHAQQAPVAPQASDDEIVVTGSLIRGTAETAALPVDVFDAEELANQGSPSTLELIKSIPASQGVLGDTNQFDSRAQGSEGSGSVNLRGLGPQRTLVLLNGRRLVINPFALAGAGAVDTNMIPSAAIGRVEVLKDGAAATYGSDAIGGVVNFITKRNFEGLEVGGSFKQVDGSDGDYTVNSTYGWQGDRADFMISLGVQHRAELQTTERDWAVRPYIDNPQGGYSAAGNPASFIPLGLSSNRARDPGCAATGGTPGLTGAPPSVSPVCYWSFGSFDNLTEKEDRYQIYSDFNLELNENHKLHVEALYGRTSVPNWKTSPSYALLQGPTALTNPVSPGNYFVPGPTALFAGSVANPGLVDFIADYPTGVPGVASATGNATTVPIAAFNPGALFIAGRPYAQGGNPLFNFGPSEGKRDYSAYRVNAALEGEVAYGVNYDLSVTYMEEVGYRTGRDTVVNRFQRALRGLGGPNCPTSGGTPGVGPCMFFNPFASAVPGNAITGIANPGYQPTLASNNERALIEWFFPFQYNRSTATLFVTDLVFSGETGVELGGGEVAWALGAQYRENGFEVELSDINNLALNPCIDSPDFGVMTCTTPTGATGFLGGAFEQDLSNEVFAIFGELNVPFTEAFEVQLAARFEDYGGAVGSTFDPKISARWQLFDGFALRASAGSTFRGPPLTSTTAGSVTALQDVFGTFRAIDIFGNPGLAPEAANTYNVGAIVEKGGFTGTVDLWQFDFENPIISEPVSGIVSTLFPNGAAGANNCGNPAFAALQARFTFTPAGCGTANIIRIRTDTVNGPAVKNSGVDVSGQYEWEQGAATLTVGGSASYILEYEVDATTVAGIQVLAAFNAVDKLNYQTQVVPIPRVKGNAFFQWNTENQNLRLTVNYIDDYVDQRTAPFTAALSTNGMVLPQGKEISYFSTVDVAYRLTLPWGTNLTVAADNITDEAPPFARLDLNYDPFTADPIGRTLKVGLQHRF